MNTETNAYQSLAETAAEPYLKCGRFVHGFVRGKLLHDPVYRAILNLNILPEQGKVVDLGCGRGILLALLTTARRLNQPTATAVNFQGIDLRAKDARIARDTLGADADIIHADVRTQAIPACQVVFLLDVLLYMDHSAQEAVLQQIAQALQPEGILVMREANAKAGFRYWMTWVGERFCAVARGHWRQGYYYRSQADWMALLESLGFGVESKPMSEGTPFANVLFIARRTE